MPELARTPRLADEKIDYPLILIVHHRGQDYSTQIYTFATDRDLFCRLSLGERVVFRPRRAPKNNQLTILTVSDLVQLTIENAHVTSPQRVTRRGLAEVVDRGRQEMRRRGFELIHNVQQAFHPHPVRALQRLRVLPSVFRRRVQPEIATTV